MPLDNHARNAADRSCIQSQNLVSRERKRAHTTASAAGASDTANTFIMTQTKIQRLDEALFTSTPATAGLLCGLMIGLHFLLGFEIAVIILLVMITLGVWQP